MSNIDEIDFKILKELQKNGKISFAEIFRRTGIPDSTIYDRISRLKEKKVIKGFTVILDDKKLGINITALVGIETRSENYGKVAKELSRIDEVIEVYGVTGEFDLMVKIKAVSMEDLSRILNVIRSMNGVDDIFVMTVLETFKEEHKVPLEKLFNLHRVLKTKRHEKY
ncbi:MAG: Lrp/AsnC family transcriptional regulator [Candidatus Odinarchaeota archaeon]|nr:Lrp/AsnC family transcriptional regulator [Candidatus Odinarchaeota archaeon]